MTDKELLEAAARAAGIDLVLDAHYDAYWHRKQPADESGPVWNPLTDDGDALRLAVKLNIRFSGEWHGSSVAFHGFQEFSELNKGDPCAATRRAIVRAAAEIGATK